MKLKFFTIPILNAQIAEVELNSFCDQHRIVNIEKHFVNDGSNSCWAVCVTWLEHEGEFHTMNQQGKKSRVDYKQILNEKDFECFAELRHLRASLRIALAQYRIGITVNDQSFIRFCLTTNKKQGCPQVSSEFKSLWDNRPRVSLCQY